MSRSRFLASSFTARSPGAFKALPALLALALLSAAAQAAGSAPVRGRIWVWFRVKSYRSRSPVITCTF